MYIFKGFHIEFEGQVHFWLFRPIFGQLSVWASRAALTTGPQKFRPLRLKCRFLKVFIQNFKGKYIFGFFGQFLASWLVKDLPVHMEQSLHLPHHRQSPIFIVRVRIFTTQGRFRTFELRLIDCFNIAGAKAPIAPVLNTPLPPSAKSTYLHQHHLC